MKFILAGFTQDLGSRVFTFARVGDDAAKPDYTVRADLALIRRYEIRMQELPLLCRSLLEKREPTDDTRTVTFTEEEMCLYAKEATAARLAAAAKRKPSRRPQTENAGAAWRGHRVGAAPGQTLAAAVGDPAPQPDTEVGHL